MGIVDEAKRLYGPYIDADTQRKLDGLGPGDQAYFWAYLYYEMPTRLGKSYLRDAMRAVESGTARLRPVIGERKWNVTEATSPHAWFRAVSD